MIKQEVVWYFNYTHMSNIYECMKMRIEAGWRVHTCLERQCDILVIYEKEIVGD